MSTKEIIQTLEEQNANLLRIETSLDKDGNYQLAWTRINRWREVTSNIISELISREEGESLRGDFHNPGWIFDGERREVEWIVKRYSSHIAVLIESLHSNPQFISMKMESTVQQAKEEPILLLEKIFSNFQLAARRLEDRYDDREAFVIKDEYDVHDLLAALLVIHFRDIRSEEGSPSSAGSSPRLDFLIKEINTVVEVKKTRKGLTDRKLGEELIIDIKRYKSHPNCKTLAIFVYDPEGRVKNPEGLISDLEERGSEVSIRVFIVPR